MDRQLGGREPVESAGRSDEGRISFGRDRTPAEEYDEEGNVIFREKELYAKWLPKDL